MVVVVGAIQVGGHHGDVVRAVLTVQELAVLQATDLRQGIRLVGLLGLLLSEEGFNGILASEVQFLVGASDDIGIALTLELAHNRATHHPTVTCYIYLTVLTYHKNV